ncbi:putative small nuclear ribonucleoprotein G [Zea mays]|uniref:Putative small nuclear ribonucleoprotein G n=2 Tax=Zea mays TaxID=4577 RepID=A0A1D6QHS1_MAIZE|nr:putative small nuclear ribonucleoprotein G [Zea mays]PWZ26325.1 putative small nuclear ribonucleoprotein G [Zea mays]
MAAAGDETKRCLRKFDANSDEQISQSGLVALFEDQYFAIEFMSGLYVQSLHISSVKLNANRLVIGTLRGFDQFMNLVINNTVDVSGNYNTHNGMVFIRGNRVVMIEALELISKSQ